MSLPSFAKTIILTVLNDSLIDAGVGRPAPGAEAVARRVTIEAISASLR
jgi:hypothetical protein